MTGYSVICEVSATAAPVDDCAGYHAIGAHARAVTVTDFTAAN